MDKNWSYNSFKAIFLLLAIVLLPSISASDFAYNYLQQPTGGNTYTNQTINNNTYYNVTGDYLKLNQSIPQTVTGGSPKFDNGLDIYDAVNDGYYHVGSENGDEGLAFSYDGGNNLFSLFADSVYSYTSLNYIFASSPNLKITESSTGGYLESYKLAASNGAGLQTTQVKKVTGSAMSNQYACTASTMRSSPHTGSWSMNFWIRPTSTSSQEYVFTMKDASSYGVQVGQAAGAFGVIIHNNFGSALYSREVATSSISGWANNWHMVSLTFNGTTLRMYIDGVEKTGTGTTFISLPGFSSFTCLGRYSDGVYKWTGLTDQSVYWNNLVLNTTDISSLYSSGMGLNHNSGSFPQSAYVTYGWELDEGTGTSVGSWASAYTLTMGSASWGTGLVSPITNAEEWDLITTNDSATPNSAYKAIWGDYSGIYGTENIHEGLSHQFNILGTSAAYLNGSGLAVTMNQNNAVSYTRTDNAAAYFLAKNLNSGNVATSGLQMQTDSGSAWVWRSGSGYVTVNLRNALFFQNGGTNGVVFYTTQENARFMPSGFNGFNNSAPTSVLDVGGNASITGRINAPIGFNITKPSSTINEAWVNLTRLGYSGSWTSHVKHNDNEQLVWSFSSGTKPALFEITSSTNLDTGFSFQGAGYRGKVYANPSYNIIIAPNAQYGTGHLIFNSTTGIGHFKIPNDNSKIILGRGENASIYFNGTDMIINPKEIGNGTLKVLGDANVTNILRANDVRATTGYYVNETAGYSGTVNVICEVDFIGLTTTSRNMTYVGGIITNVTACA